MRPLVILMLALSLAGCKKKEPPSKEVAAPAGKEKQHIDFRPTGGSSTLAGKSRDRALDARTMNDMRQVATMIDAQSPVDRKSPGSKAEWQALLRDLRTLRGLYDAGEVVAFDNVKLGPANTVLMYEKRVETENDGIVLTADGQPHRMNKTQFAALTKPK